MILMPLGIFIIVETYLSYFFYGSDYILWVFPFAFGAIFVALVELIGLHKYVIKSHGNEKLFFRPSTDFLLLISLPFIYLPLLILPEYEYLFEIYFGGITAAVRFSFGVLLILAIIFFVSRIMNERKYYKDKVKDRTLVKDILRNKKGIALFSIYVVIILILSSLFGAIFAPIYEKDISRLYSSDLEYDILKVCEDLNYSSYLNNTSEYYINSTTIDFYSDQINKYHEQNEELVSYLTYSAEVFSYGTYEIDYNKNTAGALKISSNNNVILERYPLGYIGFYYINSSTQNEPVTKDIMDEPDNLFEDNYVVYMEMYYFDSLYLGIRFDSFQIIVIDDEFNIKLIAYSGLYRDYV